MCALSLPLIHKINQELIKKDKKALTKSIIKFIGMQKPNYHI